MGTGLFGRVFR